MSMFSQMFAKSNLKKGIEKYTKARETDDESKADQLYLTAYKSFADAIQKNNPGEPEGGQALFQWGFALYCQGQTKPAQEADTLYRGACEKFSAAQEKDPGNSQIVNDWGVTLLARAQAEDVATDHDLYEQARKKFLETEALEPGLAAYNLACLHGIRDNFDGCKECLVIARDNGFLPDEAHLKDDQDIAKFRHGEQVWFADFLKSLKDEDESEEAEVKASADEQEVLSEAPVKSATVNEKKAADQKQ